MKLIVKVLGKSEEFTIDSHDSPVNIGELKILIERSRGIPVNAQRILYKGKALADSKTSEYYGITENCKLHLSVKAIENTREVSKETTISSKVEPASNNEDFLLRLEKVLKKHFREDDAERIFATFNDVYGSVIDALSLDDIERIAKYEIEKRKI